MSSSAQSAARFAARGSFSLFSSIELSDTLGRRYLVWKIEDQPPRVPPLTATPVALVTLRLPMTIVAPAV